MEQLPDINQGISKPELFEKFKSQLEKDFETCGLPHEFCKDLKPDYNEILKILISQVNGISKKYGTKLNELLYRIDISELQIKRFTKQKPNVKLEEIISELIIKRILQKVVFKQFYK